MFESATEKEKSEMSNHRSDQQTREKTRLLIEMPERDLLGRLRKDHANTLLQNKEVSEKLN